MTIIEVIQVPLIMHIILYYAHKTSDQKRYNIKFLAFIASYMTLFEKKNFMSLHFSVFLKIQPNEHTVE